VPTGDDQLEEALAREAWTLTRYLVGGAADDALAARYVAAVRALFGDAGDPHDRRVLAFALAHHWSLGPLDAAAGLLRPRGALRRRLHLVSALLETTPSFAPAFLPRPVTRPRLLWELARAGLTAGGKLAVGLVLYPLAARKAS
jgi:hypothetical protein